jgi:histone-lysine N-methyltransferase SETD3
MIYYFLFLLQFQILEKIDGISYETMLLLWSMKEKYNSNSRFKIYFNTLPEKFNTGTLTICHLLCGWYLLCYFVYIMSKYYLQFDILFTCED